MQLLAWAAIKALPCMPQAAAVEALRPIAAELGCTLAQLALAWAAKNPHVSTVITGATKVAQVCDHATICACVSCQTERRWYSHH